MQLLDKRAVKHLSLLIALGDLRRKPLICHLELHFVFLIFVLSVEHFQSDEKIFHRKFDALVFLHIVDQGELELFHLEINQEIWYILSFSQVARDNLLLLLL